MQTQLWDGNTIYKQLLAQQTDPLQVIFSSMLLILYEEHLEQEKGSLSSDKKSPAEPFYPTVPRYLSI
jgi:hypothetical protein